MTLKYIWRSFLPRLSFSRPFQQSLACFHVARSPSNSWASCLVIHVSQGSVATYVRCDGMSTKHCIANFLLSLSVKLFLKSVKIWQSYCPKFGGFLFWGHSVDVLMVFLCSSWSSEVIVGCCGWCYSLHDGVDSTGWVQWTHHWISFLLPVQ